LRKEGVQVGVMELIGDLEYFNELKEIWIQLEDIPPECYDWRLFAQIASGIGLMLEVDWSSLFKSFYEHVRIMVAYRNPLRIPKGEAI
jgi:hypothetical protein